MPGDEIAFAQGRVLVDGAPLAESYIAGDVTVCGRGPHCAVTVPPGTVYVLGDNRRRSLDSRAFGPVSLDAVIGKAWLSNWPPSDAGLIPDAEYE